VVLVVIPAAADRPQRADRFADEPETPARTAIDRHCQRFGQVRRELAGALRENTGAARRSARTLGVRDAKQGVGLDFVRRRGYGRLRWLDYPAKRSTVRWLSMMMKNETEESWPFPS
jgi:hypothetical protein